MKAVEWIDRAKTECGWETDYRAAKELCITRSSVSAYRTGIRQTLDEETSIKVAEALGLRPAVVMFDQMRERSKSPKVRGVLDEAIKSAGGKAAGVLLAVALGVGAAGSPGSARAGAINPVAVQAPGIYIV